MLVGRNVGTISAHLLICLCLASGSDKHEKPRWWKLGTTAGRAGLPVKAQSNNRTLHVFVPIWPCSHICNDLSEMNQSSEAKVTVHIPSHLPNEHSHFIVFSDGDAAIQNGKWWANLASAWISSSDARPGSPTRCVWQKEQVGKCFVNPASAGWEHRLCSLLPR